MIETNKEILYLTAHWEQLEKQRKNIPLGSNIEIDYKKYDDFTIKKI